jgi:hypothetical protein
MIFQKSQPAGAATLLVVLCLDGPASRTRTCTNSEESIASGECPSRFLHWAENESVSGHAKPIKLMIQQIHPHVRVERDSGICVARDLYAAYKAPALCETSFRNFPLKFVNVWLQGRSLPARGRVGLDVHRCLCIIDAGNVFIFTVMGPAASFPAAFISTVMG